MPAPRLLDPMLQEDNLLAAWHRVQQNGGRAGLDGVTLADFARQGVARQLARLAAQVREGKYVPQPLLQLRIPKEGSRLRALAIPTVRDRILQTAACRVLSPILEPQFETASYGYRPERSARMAVEEIVRLRDAGFRWVVDADIYAYFDEIDHDRLLAEFDLHVGDADLRRLVAAWVRARIKSVEGPWIEPVKGIPQGAPISPLIANLYLDDFDEAIMGKGHKLVRFADDFLILCRSESEAQNALELTQDVVAALSIRLNMEKTRLTHFDEGFRFLGVDFLRDALYADPQSSAWVLPLMTPRAAFKAEAGATIEPVMRKAMQDALAAQRQVGPETAGASPAAAETVVETAADAESDDDTAAEQWVEEAGDEPPYLRTLHLVAPGLTLSRASERIVVAKGADQLREIPIHTLDQVILNGNVFVTTAALRLCIENGVSVHFADFHGTPYASLEDGQTDRAMLRAAQYAAHERPAFQMRLARALVLAKIAAQSALLRRYLRHHPAPEGADPSPLTQMARMRDGALSAKDLDALRGYEGMAARTYFGALRRIVPDEFGFGGREAHPPGDPVNAMLSYGYTVLYANLLTLIQRRGLDPSLGFLHAARDGYCALASDLMEPYRAPVVDGTVLALITRRQLRPEGFEMQPGGRFCRMHDTTKRTLIHALESKLAAPAHGGHDWRRAMALDVVSFEHALQGKGEFKVTTS